MIASNDNGEGPNASAQESKELRMAVDSDKSRQLILVDFGTMAVTQISMTPQQAVEFAETLVTKARQVSLKPLKYTIS